MIDGDCDKNYRLPHWQNSRCRRSRDGTTIGGTDRAALDFAIKYRVRPNPPVMMHQRFDLVVAKFGIMAMSIAPEVGQMPSKTKILVVLY